MSDLFLFHGTASEFNKVDLKCTKDFKDFGKGFYLTSDKSQAIRWSHDVRVRTGSNIELVYSFKLNKEVLYDSFSVHPFPKMDRAWLDYVVYHRNNKSDYIPDFDVVVGAVADSELQRLLSIYSKNRAKMSEKERDEFAKRFIGKDLVDQYCFKSTDVIKFLNSCTRETVHKIANRR